MGAREARAGEFVEGREQVLVPCERGGVFGADGEESAQFEGFTREEESAGWCGREGSERVQFEEGEFGS